MNLIEHGLTLPSPSTRWVTNTYGFTNTRREDYSYDLGGRVTTVKVGEGSWNGSGVSVPTGTSGTLRSYFIYDKMGRLTRQIDYHLMPAAANANEFRAYDRTLSYNVKGQIATENTFTIRTQDT